MLSIDTLSLFFTTCVLLSLSPGPDNLFVLMQSITQGAKAGSVITLGLCTGLLTHAIAVVLGVAVIFQSSELAFTVLKLIGAGYLLYLAWGAFTAKATHLEEQTTSLSTRQLYVRGVIMSTTNPKLSIFFLAFLPQFVDPNEGSMTLQLIQLSIVFIITAFLVFNCIAMLAGKMGRRIAHSERAQIWLNRMAGTVFIGLAIKLASAEIR